jgi:hypothetical protein
MQAASRQISAAIDEMRKRMTELQEETRRAIGSTKESTPGSATASKGKRGGGAAT